MVNKAILIGNLGKDPEISYTPSGVAVCKATLATTERWTNRDGEKQEKTEWHNLVFWRRQAEVANEYLRKGSRIYVEGRITHRSWEGNDGVKRYSTDIEVQSFQMLSSRSDRTGAPRSETAPSEARQEPAKTPPAAEKESGSGKPGDLHYENIPQEPGAADSFGGKKDDDLPF